MSVLIAPVMGSINFDSTPGEAMLDFVPVNSWITLNVSSPRRCAAIEIIHDHIHEEVEQFVAVISNDALPSHVILNPATTKIKVINIKRRLAFCIAMSDTYTTLMHYM